MKAISGLFVLVFLIVGVTGQFYPVLAQGEDCGNGLIQRLQVGMRGWIDPAPPAQGVRMRVYPGDSEVARLQPGESFDVLDGPMCYDGHSWYEVAADSGKQGWIAEGIEAGVYFVDPLSSSAGDASGQSRVIPLANTDAECRTESNLMLGQFVELTREYEDIVFYYGHPLVENGLFRVGDLLDLSFTLYEDIYYDFDWPAEAYLTVAGPHCFNGGYVWQIAPMDTVMNSQGQFSWDNYFSDGRTPFFWIHEMADGQTQLRLSDIVAPQSVTYTASHVVLSRNDTAPIIDAQGQIEFSFGAGGGDMYQPFFWSEPICDDAGRNPAGYLGAANTTAVISTYFNQCMYLYPFNASDDLTVTIYDPQGEMYRQYMQAAAPILLKAEVTPASMSDDSLNVIEDFLAYGVRVELPHELGIAEGVWSVQVTNGTRTVSRAYGYDEYGATDFDTDEIRPDMTGFCDGPVPLIQLTGFAPHAERELVLVEGDTSSVLGDFISAFVEIDRWSVVFGEQGELIFTTDFPHPEGLFILAAEDGSWDEQIEIVSIDGVRGLGVLTQEDCRPYETAGASLRRPLASGDSAIIRDTDSAFFSLQIEENDLIRLDAVSMREDYPADTVLELYDPNYRLIAHNDNAENPVYGVLDSSISGILAIESGLYTVHLTTKAAGEMRIWFDFSLETADELVGAETITFGVMQAAALNSDGAVWTFTGDADQRITIDVQSSSMDVMIEVHDGDGNLIAEDDDSGSGTNARITGLTLPSGQDYLLVVKSWGHKTGIYNVLLQTTAP